MTKTFKDRLINAAISVIGSLIVLITGGFYVLKRDGAIALKQDVEHLKVNKADKEELKFKLNKSDYEKDQVQRWDAHDKINDLQEKRAKETYDMVKFLYEEQIKKNNKQGG